MNGLREGWVHECIVTTYHKEGSSNAAPIGVRAKGEDEIIIRVHTTTDTYRNIERERVFCVNVVYDPFIFLKSAVMGHGKGAGEVELEGGEFEGCARVNAPYLKSGAAFFEVEVEGVSFFEKDDEVGTTRFAEVIGRILKTHIIDEFPLPYNRGLGAAVELAVDLSRGNKDNVARHLKVMDKVMPEEEVEKIRSLIEGL